jgi:hypothetical protein
MPNPNPATPKGFTCECGTINEFPGYVFAHWHDLINFTCNCGRKFAVIRGDAHELRQPKHKRVRKGKRD